MLVMRHVLRARSWGKGGHRGHRFRSTQWHRSDVCGLGVAPIAPYVIGLIGGCGHLLLVSMLLPGAISRNIVSTRPTTAIEPAPGIRLDVLLPIEAVG